ncbi:MAG TPA: hypothetical protein VNT32_06280 [Thermoleophilaceae bacterium]|nr:hypothetical protein [Thermoleophilaceae bacterium]
MRERSSVRAPVDAGRVRELAGGLGRVAPEGTRLYLTGGATAVLEGWRSSTIVVDARFEPESDRVLAAIPALKLRLDLNVELVSPTDFIPELPGWRDRSPFLFREGALDVHHFDPYSQALSKVERGFGRDLEDVAEMVRRGMVLPSLAVELFEASVPALIRYPALDEAAFRAKVLAAFQ